MPAKPHPSIQGSAPMHACATGLSCWDCGLCVPVQYAARRCSEHMAPTVFLEGARIAVLQVLSNKPEHAHTVGTAAACSPGQPYL